MMEIGIDSFAAWSVGEGGAATPSEGLRQLVERIEYADQVGLDVFGVGEHHRKEFLDSAPPVILAAAAMRTKQYQADECGDGVERGRSGAGVSAVCDAGSVECGACGDGGGAGFVH